MFSNLSGDLVMADEIGPLPLRFDFVCRVEVDVAEPLNLGVVPGGERRIINITGGHFVGPRMSGRVLAGGADWQFVDANGVALIDTRYCLECTDGELISIATQGFRHGPPEVLARLAAGEQVPPSEYYFRITARLESSAPAYSWVNRSIFVASAARESRRVVYDLHELL